MMMDEISVLVADSGAFIKAAPLESWSGNVVTVKEVVSEIRDANTRRRLQVLPYTLGFREPSQEALHHVTAFAKKTGDYRSLSPVDLKVMALTYQLECEVGPEKGANLRTEPVNTQLGSEKPKIPGMVGFYSGHKASREASDTAATNPEVEPSEHGATVKPLAYVSHGELEHGTLEHCESEVAVAESQTGTEEIPSRRDVQTLKEFESSQVQDGGRTCSELERNGGCVVEQHEDSGKEWDSDSDDEEGWITPENLQQVCREMGGVQEEEPRGIAVGCITTDYAMQNVMLQMGLNVISVEGMRIRQLRTYGLQCKACFKTTLSPGEVFCPSCGHRTLIKVSVVVDSKGAVHYRPLSQKQFSHKGLRYPLPLPKGGRHTDNPVLAPDQRVTYKERRRRANKVDPLDPDYIARSSPFAMNDTTSRGAQIAFSKGGGGGSRRRNPNAVRPKGKKK